MDGTNSQIKTIVFLSDGYTAKKRTALNNVVQNRLEQCCSVHSCEQHRSALLHLIRTQQCCSLLLTTVNNVGSTTLFNPVVQAAGSAAEFLAVYCMHAIKLAIYYACVLCHGDESNMSFKVLNI